MTASCGIEGNKAPTAYQGLIEGALQKSKYKPEKVIVWQREQLRWDPVRKELGERNWQRLVKSAKNRGLKADPVPVKSNDGIYIIYTSGRHSHSCIINLSDIDRWIQVQPDYRKVFSGNLAATPLVSTCPSSIFLVSTVPVM